MFFLPFDKTLNTGNHSRNSVPLVHGSAKLSITSTCIRSYVQIYIMYWIAASIAQVHTHYHRVR